MTLSPYQWIIRLMYSQHQCAMAKSVDIGILSSLSLSAVIIIIIVVRTNF